MRVDAEALAAAARGEPAPPLPAVSAEPRRRDEPPRDERAASRASVDSNDRSAPASAARPPSLSRRRRRRPAISEAGRAALRADAGAGRERHLSAMFQAQKRARSRVARSDLRRDRVIRQMYSPGGNL